MSQYTVKPNQNKLNQIKQMSQTNDSIKEPTMS